MLEHPKILIVGGGSRIAAALAGRLGEAAITVARRSTGRSRDVLVEDYSAIPSETLARMDCVINCVGASGGRPALLDDVNIAIPLRLAEAARACGVGHLIHISSFSVYGKARAIDRATPTKPMNAYGRSKLMADERLLAMAGPGFDVTILRLPLVYGENLRGKVGRLLKLWRHVRWLPAPAGDIRRAVIGVDLAAEVLTRLAEDTPRTGVHLAADPRPFTYGDAARSRPEKLNLIPIPRPLSRLAERAAPSLGGRLFGNSDLAASDNLVTNFGLPSRLYRDIAIASL